MPASQAGRRGFDPRLPLHLFNNLQRTPPAVESNRVHQAPIASSYAFTAALRQLIDVIVYTFSFTSTVCLHVRETRNSGRTVPPSPDEAEAEVAAPAGSAPGAGRPSPQLCRSRGQLQSGSGRGGSLSLHRVQRRSLHSRVSGRNRHQGLYPARARPGVWRSLSDHPPGQPVSRSVWQGLSPGRSKAYGIPPFRLPREIVACEIGRLRELGVEILTDH